ncbi:MAG: hypothetical protein AAB225_30950 [Acidobacteriota bacterium]
MTARGEAVTAAVSTLAAPSSMRMSGASQDFHLARASKARRKTSRAVTLSMRAKRVAEAIRQHQ